MYWYHLTGHLLFAILSIYALILTCDRMGDSLFASLAADWGDEPLQKARVRLMKEVA
jgi:hypothetical protein